MKVLSEFLKVLVSLEKVSCVAATINKVTRLLILCIFRSKVTKNTKALQHYFATLALPGNFPSRLLMWFPGWLNIIIIMIFSFVM